MVDIGAGSVRFEAELNLDGLERQLQYLERRLRSVKFEIPAMSVGNAGGQISQLNKMVIKPQVDHKPLTELNKHLDKKKKHWDDLNNHFSRRPLNPKTGAGGSAVAIPTEKATKQIQKQYQLFQDSPKQLQVKTKDTDTLIRSFEDNINEDKRNKLNILQKEENKTNMLGEAVKGFGASVDKFEKANKRTLLGSLFRGAIGAIGNHLMQLMIYKVSESLSKGMANFTQKIVMTGHEGDTERYVIQKAIQAGMRNYIKEMTNPQELQNFIAGSYLISASLQDLTRKMSQQDNIVGTIAEKTTQQLDTFNNTLFDILRELTVGELIHSSLQQIVKIVGKGFAFGFSRAIGLAVSAAIIAPAKILTGSLQKTGADKAAATTTPFSQMMEKVLGDGKSFQQRKDESFDRAFITAALIKSFKDSPKQAINSLFARVNKDWGGLLGQLNIKFRALQMIAPTSFKKITDPLLGILIKATSQDENKSPGMLAKGISFVTNLIEKTKEKINEIETSFAEKITGLSKSELIAQIEQEPPITSEDFLKRIYESLLRIEKNITRNANLSSKSDSTQNQSQIKPPKPVDPQLFYRTLLPLIDRIRLQGGRIVGGVKEKKEEGGMKLLAQNFPDLGLDLKTLQGKNKKVSELKGDLQSIVEQLIDTQQFDKLNEIAEFMVRNWSSLAREEHKNYSPTLDTSPTVTRLRNNQPQENIDENWDVTTDTVVDELNKLLKISKDVGYKVQKNISEGSPGITKNIRTHWTKTIDFIIKQLVKLVNPSKVIGEKIKKGLEVSFSQLDIFINNTIKKIQSLNFDKIKDKAKESLTNVTSLKNSENKNRVLSDVVKGIDKVKEIKSNIEETISSMTKDIVTEILTVKDSFVEKIRNLKDKFNLDEGEVELEGLSTQIISRLKQLSEVAGNTLNNTKITGFLDPIKAIFESIENNINLAVSQLEQIGKLTDMTPYLNTLEKSIQKLKFKLLFNSVKTVKTLSKYFDFQIDLDDGWKKNIVKFITRGLYLTVKTTLRELGIALGHLATYIAKDLQALFQTIYNSQTFAPIKEDIESFVGQLQDVFEYFQKQINKVSQLFGKGSKSEKQEKETSQSSAIEAPREEIYFKRLFIRLEQTLNNLNRAGRKQVASTMGVPLTPTTTGSDLLNILIDKIEFNPQTLKDVITTIETNWDEINLDTSEWENPFKELGSEIDLIEQKWGHTGNYFAHVLKTMEQQGKKTRKSLTSSLADKSPGLTQDVRDRWRYTSKDVGRSMATMASQGESTFQRLTDGLRGIKITSAEVSNSLLNQLKQKAGGIANDLIDRGEIQFYDILGINLNDVNDVNNLIDSVTQRFAQLNDIQLQDAQSVLEDFSGVLNKRENASFREVRQNLKEINSVKKEIQTKLANPPKFVNAQGNLDKKAILSYFGEIERSIKRYEVLLGNISNKIKFNPNVEKALKSLPLEARKNFNTFINSASSGLIKVQDLANSLNTEFESILNLDPDSLKRLGLPEKLINQVNLLVEKGKEFRKQVEFQDFVLPSIEETTQQAERTLGNIYEKTAKTTEIKQGLNTGQEQRKGIESNIKTTKQKFDADYKRLIEQGKNIEAQSLRDSYRNYLKSRSQQIKDIKDTERKYATELADIAIQLGEFTNESSVADYIGSFDSLGQGLNNLIELIQSGNDELKNTTIEIANSLNAQVTKYNDSVQAIQKIEQQIIKTTERRQKLNDKIQGQINKATEAGNLQRAVKLEEKRKEEVAKLDQKITSLNQKLRTRVQLQEQLKQDVFNVQQSGSLVDINALYETEKPIDDTINPDTKQLTFFEKLKNILKEIPVLAKNTFSSLTKGFDDLKNKYPVLQSVENGFKRFGLSIATLVIGIPVAFKAISSAVQAGTRFIVNQVQQLSAASFSAAVSFESLQAQFKFVYGEASGVSALKAFEKQTNALGQSFDKMTKKFVQFRMGLATVGMENMAESMTADIQKALTVREASPEEGERALNALNQIASKGKLQLEDLNQLREALPGTLPVAARAMNVSASEFSTMISRGQVSADEFLPKFTSALGREADPAMDTALDTTLTKLNQLDNRLTELKRKLGEGSVAIARPLIDALNVSIEFIVDYADKIALIGVSLAINFFTPFATIGKTIVASLSTISAQIIGTIRNIQLNFISGISSLDSAQRTFFLSVKTNLAALKASLFKLAGVVATTMKLMIKALAPILAIALTLEGISGIISFNKEAISTADRLQTRYDKILETLNKIQNVELTNEERQESELQQRRNSDTLGTGNFAFDTVDAIRRFLTTITFTGDKFAGSTISARKYEEEFATYSEGLRKLLDSGTLMDQIVISQGGESSYINKKAELDNEIKNTAAMIRGLQTVGSPEAREQVKILRELNQERQNELNQLQQQFFPSGDYESQIKELENYLALYKSKVEEGLDPQGFYSRQIPLIEGEISNLENRSKSMTEALREATHAMANLGRELTKVSVKSEATKFANDLSLSANRQVALQNQLAQDVPQGINNQISMAEIDVLSSAKELERLQQESRDLASTIANTNDQAMVTNLLTFFEGIGFAADSLNDISYEALLMAETYKDLDENQLEVIKSLKRGKELNIQTAQATEQNLQSQISLKTLQRDRALQIRDFNRQVEDLDVTIADYFRQRQRALEDFELQLQDLSIQTQREGRDLLEQYQDLQRTLTQQLNSAANELATIKRDIQRQARTNQLRGQLDFGGAGAFNDLITLFDQLQTSENDFQVEVLTIEEQRLANEQEVLNIARQIRALNEQKADLERNRFRQLRDLSRQQEDFVLQQIQSWRNIQRQVEDMEIRAREMGIAFSGIAGSLDGINQSYAEIHNSIAQFAQDIANSTISTGGAGGGAIGETGSGLKQYAENVVFPLAGLGYADIIPGQGFNASREGGRRRHNGADYAVPTGTPLYAPFEGRITSIYEDKGEFGVHITSLDGLVTAHLNHLNRLDVRMDQLVGVADQIGLTGGDKGSWGSSVSHLDFKIKVNGQFIPVETFFANPTAYFSPTNTLNRNLGGSVGGVTNPSATTTTNTPTSGNTSTNTNNNNNTQTNNNAPVFTLDPVVVARDRMTQAESELNAYMRANPSSGRGRSNSPRYNQLRQTADQRIDEYYTLLIQQRSREMATTLSNIPDARRRVQPARQFLSNLQTLQERYREKRPDAPNTNVVNRGFRTVREQFEEMIRGYQNAIQNMGSVPLNFELTSANLGRLYNQLNGVFSSHEIPLEFNTEELTYLPNTINPLEQEVLVSSLDLSVVNGMFRNNPLAIPASISELDLPNLNFGGLGQTQELAQSLPRNPRQAAQQLNNVFPEQQRIAFTIQYMLEKGLSRIDVAAWIGNFMQESRLNPYIQNPRSENIGIAQWSRDRWTPSWTFNPQEDLKNQLDHWWRENQGTERANYRLALNAQGLENKVRTISEKWFRPGGHEANIAERVRLAEQSMGLNPSNVNISGTNASFRTPNIQPITAPDMSSARNRLNASVLGSGGLIARGSNRETPTNVNVTNSNDISNDIGNTVADVVNTAVVDYINVEPLIDFLSQNQLINDEQLRQLLLFKESGQIEQIQPYLESLGINIQTALEQVNEARVEQVLEERRARQLENERQVRQTFETLRNSIESLTQNFERLSDEINKAVANAKGFLTYAEELTFARRDVEVQFQQLDIQATQILREYAQIMDFSDPNQMIEQLQARVTEMESDPNRSTVSDAIIEYLKQNLPLIGTGLISLQQLKEGFETAVVSQLEGAKDIALNAVNTMTTMQQEIAKTRTLANAGAFIGERLSQAGSITQGTEIRIQVEQMNAMNAYREILGEIRVEIERLGDSEEDRSRKAQLELYKELILNQELVEYYEIRKRLERESQNNIRDNFGGLYRFLGESERQINPFGGGSDFLRLAEEIDILSRFGAELERIGELLRQNQDNPSMLRTLGAFRDRILELQNLELEAISQKVSIFAQSIKEPLQTAIGSIITEWAMGTKSLGEIFATFLQQVASFFAQLASQMIANQAMKWLSGLFGGVSGGLFKGGIPVSTGASTVGTGSAVAKVVGGIATPSFSMGGEVANFNDGGAVESYRGIADGTIIADKIPNLAPLEKFKKVKAVGNYFNGGLVKQHQDLIGLGASVKQAMLREGANAVPAVLHIGEQVLTDHNGDAQAFRQLQKSGDWEKIKQEIKTPQVRTNTPNFFNGGSVGNINSSSNSYMLNRSNNPMTNTTIFNITTPDAMSFRKSQSLIAQEQKLKEERNKRFT